MRDIFTREKKALYSFTLFNGILIDAISKVPLRLWRNKKEGQIFNAPYTHPVRRLATNALHMKNTGELAVAVQNENSLFIPMHDSKRL